MATRPPGKLGPALYSQTKHVIYNVYKFFKNRKLEPTSTEHRDDINIYKTVAAAVGVSDRTVGRLVKEAHAMQAEQGRIIFHDPKNTRKQEMDLDNAIRDKYLEFIRRKEKPTINKIRIELLEDEILLCSYDYMKLQLKRLGFRFRPARPRFKLKKVDLESVKNECDMETEGGAGISGFQLEHVTVKLEPLEPGYEGGVISTRTTTSDDLECDVHIKVEEHEFNDDN